MQRLSALRNFVINKTLKLQELEFLKDLDGETYDSLPRSLQRKIEETQIVAYIIKPGTPPKVKYNIFRRINTGGLVLEPQEIRHALNQGTPAKYVANLADTHIFKKATENKISTSRMLDREFVTRFIAFYVNGTEAYTPDLDSFLNNSMSQIANMSPDKLALMKNDFTESMEYSFKIFGKWAFRKADLYPQKRKPINKALFEVWSVNLAKLTQDERQIVLSKKEELISNFVKLMKTDAKFLRSITAGTGGKSEVVERFSKIKMLLNQIV